MVEIYENLAGERRWPFCEAFLGAFVEEHPEIRYANIDRYGLVKRYEFWPPHRFTPDLFGAEPEFVHPVLDDQRFIQSRLMHGGDQYFDSNSDLRKDLDNLPLSLVLPQLCRCFEIRKERSNLFRLQEYLRKNGLAYFDFAVNIAISGQASLSSIPGWFTGELEKSAAAPIYARPGPRPSFHAGPAVNPWWSVDLLESFFVEEIVIYNRTDSEEMARRSQRFSVLGSLNGSEWEVWFVKSDGDPVGVDDAPYRVKLHGKLGRFVRIRNDGDAMLASTREVDGKIDRETRVLDKSIKC
jgi:hypothetical protein